MDIQILLSSFFNRKKQQNTIDINKLPSQGYFYPKGLEIFINKGTIDDQILYYHGIDNSNIFGVISTIKLILIKRVYFNYSNFKFDMLRAIDILFIFIEFIKYTTNKRVFFDGIEFSDKNFVYFNFDQFESNYDIQTKSFIFGEWKFSLPSIGIETSLSKFSYEISVKGQSDKYRDKNYNLIYFLGDKTELSYNNMVNLIETFEDLDDIDQKEINDIIEKFTRCGLYYLIEIGKNSVRINPSTLIEIWPLSESDNIFIENS